MRLVDLKFSIANQIFEILLITLLAIPSYINPLIPIILLISYFYFSFNLNSSREVLILNQYFDNKNKITISIIIKIILLIIFFLNYELLSPKTYQVYKIKELELRNNFKLGLPKSNEFHIDGELSIFYKSKIDKSFFDIESILYRDNQFIKSESAVIEYGKLGFNIIFINGIRIKMNKTEKSKTIFEKFTYNINKTDFEELLLDKEHFNTKELITNKQKDLINHGHSRIINYLIFIIILMSSNKIIYKNILRKDRSINNIIVFLFLIIIYVFNSFFLYLLNQEQININGFYLFNSLFLILYLLYIFKYYEN